MTPFFIVGSGRSGTTLLRMILSSHSSISIPPETWYIIPLVEKFPLNAELSAAQVKDAVDIICSHYRWSDIDVESQQLSAWAGQLDKPCLRDIIDLIYNHYLEKEGKRIWGDKTPPYIRYVPQLSALYPEAKFIHLIRDGRDVTRSFMSRNWIGPWLHNKTYEWKKSIQCHMQYSKDAALHSRILVVKYEELVLETEKTTRGICRFLGIEFEQNMLDWAAEVEKKVPSREIHIHEKLFRKPERSDIYRWKKEMTAREILVTESFIGKELRETGYQLKYNSILYEPVFFLTRVYCQTVLPILTLLTKLFRYLYQKLR